MIIWTDFQTDSFTNKRNASIDRWWVTASHFAMWNDIKHNNVCAIPFCVVLLKTHTMFLIWQHSDQNMLNRLCCENVSETVFSCCGYDMRCGWGKANCKQDSMQSSFDVSLCAALQLCSVYVVLCWYLLAPMYLDDFNAHSVFLSQCHESNPVHLVSWVLLFLTCLLLKDLESSCSIRLW